MLGMMIKLLPLFLYFALGYLTKLVLVKKTRISSKKVGEWLLQVVFLFVAPALVFSSIVKVRLEPDLFWLCALPPVIVAVVAIISFALRRLFLQAEPIKTFGMVPIGSMIKNLGLVIAIVQIVYGPDGLARVSLIDGANTVMSFTMVYFLAVKFGHDQLKPWFAIRRLLSAPPLWALILALVCKATGFMPPGLLMDMLSGIGWFVGPGMLVALGLLFSFRLQKLIPVSLLLCFVVGGLIGFGFVKLSGFQGLTAQIVLLASLAPIGYYSLAFALREGLDLEFASSQVSISLLLALLASPFVVSLVGLLVP